MRCRLPSAPLCALSLAVIAPTRADVIFNDFSNTQGLALLGDAAQQGNSLRLVSGPPNRAGGIWAVAPQRVDIAWTSEFSFVLSGPGDGVAFVVQTQGAGALGGSGCELGYHGIVGGLAVEFDTWSDSSCSAGTVGDPGALHISVHLSGPAALSVSEQQSIGATTLVSSFADGLPHDARIVYFPGQLQVYVDDLTTPALAVAVDLGQSLALSQGMATVGLTGSAGILGQTEDLTRWVFDEDAFAPGGNQPPLPPVITEPAVNGLVVNPFDVHMETGPMSDPNPGDVHVCSDFEIWNESPVERVWIAPGVTGPEKIHSHLGDGTFVGSLAGAGELGENTDYVLRIRHKDSSGDPLTEWSPWSERSFTTGDYDDRYPLILSDILDAPDPDWRYDLTGQPAVLPAGSPPARMTVSTTGGQVLLLYEGLDWLTNTVINPPDSGMEDPVRIDVESRGNLLSLSESNLVIYDHHCERFTITLPNVSLQPNEMRSFWVSTDGATWNILPSHTEPTFDSLARGSSLGWAVLQPGFEIEVVTTGLTLPVNIAFVPNPGPDPGDPFLYVTELYGSIKVMTRDGTVSDYATGLLNYNPSGVFPGSGEQGLSGIAVHPTTGDVYAAMLYESPNPSLHYPKVVRLTSLDGGLTAATNTTILDMVGEAQGQSHQISHVEFLPDGTLLVHMGDGFQAPNALNLNSYRGKILRMLENGQPVPSNPLYDPSNGITARDYVWVYGVRNPFGGRYREADGFSYVVENGPSIDRFAKLVPGASLGWAGSNGNMVIGALYNWNPATGPVNLAFIQTSAFGGSGFPTSKLGHAFVSESGPTYATGPQSRGKRIREYVLDAAGSLVGDPIPFVEYVGTGKATAVGLAAGPDGLYFTELYNDDGPNPTASGARMLRVFASSSGDCNNNGIPDACDIATGTSADANGNGIPDECECVTAAYCPAAPNSTGVGAAFASTGGCTIAPSNLEFEVVQLPPGQPGYFIASQTQGSAAVGQGTLCLAGSIYRFNAFVQFADPGGAIQFEPDLTSPPPGMSVAAGQTWNFQYWYRDWDPVATSNFSNGVELLLQ